MKLVKTSAPFINSGKSPNASMKRMIVCLGLTLLYATFFFGLRVPVNAVISILACEFCELLVSKMVRLPSTAKDFSAMVTALMIVLLLPATAPIWLILVADSFAIFIAKAVFGGLGHNPFNPAACAMAFITVCWPTYIFRYPTVPQTLPIISSDLSKVTFGSSVLSYVNAGGVAPYRLSDIFFGAVPAAVGAGCGLVILACFVYLTFKRTIHWKITAAFLLSFAIFSALMPRTGLWHVSVFSEIFSGYLLFAAVFMLTDPSTSPKSDVGGILYGAICAIAVILLRRYGIYEEGLCFALIICNAVAPTLDRWVSIISQRR